MKFLTMFILSLLLLLTGCGNSESSSIENNLTEPEQLVFTVAAGSELSKEYAFKDEHIIVAVNNVVCEVYNSRGEKLDTIYNNRAIFVEEGDYKLIFANENAFDAHAVVYAASQEIEPPKVEFATQYLVEPSGLKFFKMTLSADTEINYSNTLLVTNLYDENFHHIVATGVLNTEEGVYNLITSNLSSTNEMPFILQ